MCTRAGQVTSADDVRQLHKLQRKRESGELDDSEAAVLKSLSQSLQVREFAFRWYHSQWP